MLNVSYRRLPRAPLLQATTQMARNANAVRISLLLATGLLPVGNICRAQGAGEPAPAQARREFESRAALETQAKEAEAQHRTNEAWLLKQRLQKGDFQDGDRIIVSIQGNSLAAANFVQIPGTLSVRAGRLLELPRMADLSLDGVLRSELNDRLTQHLAQYIKEPAVRSTPLVRMAILGAVTRPGYVYTAADAPLSDVIMQAGGPGADANMGAITISRGSEVIWNAQDTRAALADGMSVDRLHLRAGDEVTVPTQNRIQWLALFSVVVSSAALVLAFIHR